MKKKILCVILSVLIAAAAFPFAVFASGEKEVPVIIVGGYSSSQLFYNTDNGEMKVWSLNFDYLHDEFVQYESDIIKSGVNVLTKKDYLGFVHMTGGTVADYVSILALDPDGFSANNVYTYDNDPAKMNLAALLKDGPEDAIKEQRIISMLEENISDENIFMFNCDWRLNALLCADALAEFVKAVKEYTGSEKVSLFGESHGGEVIAAYLSLCSIIDSDKSAIAELTDLSVNCRNFSLEDIDNSVLYCPAMGGVELCYDILHEFDINLPAVIDFSTNCNGVFPWNSAYSSELNIGNLFGDIPVDFANIMASAWMEYYVYQYLITFGSIWDFIPVSEYTDYRDSFVEQNGKGLMIERSDYMHSNIMGTYNYNKNLTYAINNSVQVSIVAGYGNNLAIGDAECSSDGLVALTDSTGAKVTPLGTRFADGYTTPYGSKSVLCNDFSHNHVSPDMTADVSYGYLPENTWMVQKLWHAQYASESYTCALVKALLFGNVKDVYQYSSFPQYKISTNEQMGVYAEFNNSKCGYLTSSDSALYIKNLSSSSAIEITSVKVQGADISFNVKSVKLKPGESTAVTFSGQAPKDNAHNILITIYYINTSSYVPLNYRNIYFTSLSADAQSGATGDLSPVYTVNAPGAGEIQNVFGIFAIIKAFIAKLSRMLHIILSIGSVI